MKWCIVCDSSCDLDSLPIRSEDIGFVSVPFTISIDSKEYVDNNSINLASLISDMESSSGETHTSCPSPGDWYNAFMEADNILAMTISKELSGSFNSAWVARDMAMDEDSKKNIAIFNTASTGPIASILAECICDEIFKGSDFDTVVKATEKKLNETQTVFSLCSFKNLVKSGRLSKAVGLVAKILGIWGVGVASAIGKIEILCKVKGTGKMIASVIDSMKEKQKKITHVVISHVSNPEIAELLKSKILEIWDNAVVEIRQAHGLNSYYAEKGGLIVAYI